MGDECNLDEKEKEIVVNEVRRRLTPQAVKIRSDIEVSCYEYEGIDAVKRALKAGLSCCTEDSQIKCNLIAPPIYVFTMTTLEKTEGLDLLNVSIEKVKASIEAAGGTFNSDDEDDDEKGSDEEDGEGGEPNGG